MTLQEAKEKLKEENPTREYISLSSISSTLDGSFSAKQLRLIADLMDQLDKDDKTTKA